MLNYISKTKQTNDNKKVLAYKQDNCVTLPWGCDVVTHGDRCLAPGTVRPAALPLTDGCPFRKSPLIMKLEI